jgi:superfamily II DNA helicase RecQ
VIVTPFVALTYEVRDRVAATVVRVAFLSEMTLQDTDDSARVFDVVIVAAEQVATGEKYKNLMSKLISAGESEPIVFDEAHFFWLHADFRDRLRNVRTRVRPTQTGLSGSATVPPILMLTAAAPMKCAGAISAACGASSLPYVIQSLCKARHNLCFKGQITSDMYGGGPRAPSFVVAGRSYSGAPTRMGAAAVIR